MERGETAVEAARREAFEQVGATCHIEPQLLGVFMSHNQFQSHQIALFVCNNISRTQQINSWESEEGRTFSLTDLPKGVWPDTERCVVAHLAGDAASAGVW